MLSSGASSLARWWRSSIGLTAPFLPAACLSGDRTCVRIAFSRCRRPRHRGRRSSAHGFGRPQPALLQQRVGQHRLFAHDRRQGDLRRLAAGAQFGVLAGHVRVAAQRRDRCHVQVPARPRPTAADEAAALPLAGLARPGRDPDQARRRRGRVPACRRAARRDHWADASDRRSVRSVLTDA